MDEELKKKFYKKFCFLYENNTAKESYHILSQDRNEPERIWQWIESSLKEARIDGKFDGLRVARDFVFSHIDAGYDNAIDTFCLKINEQIEYLMKKQEELKQLQEKNNE